jgi:hypothetical protein
MNPEFKRNLWRVFTPQRLIVTPALLGLVFLAIAMSNDGKLASNGYGLASGLFIVIVWFWGLRLANASIIDEMRDKTWDQQRMSALSPWAMAWGKLFGATAFAWYAGLICLTVAAVCGWTEQGSAVLLRLTTLVATGILLHAASIALNLHTSQNGARIVQRGGMVWLGVPALLLLLPNGIRRFWSDATVDWWGMAIGSTDFAFFSSALFAGCAVFAAWRTMSNALQVRTLPWAWPLFALVLAGYCAGFANAAANAYVFYATALAVAAGLTYFALVTEPSGLLVWQRLKRRRELGDWRGWLERLPLWPTTLVLAFIFAGLASSNAPGFAAPPTLNRLFGLAPLGVALMLLRDVCVFLFFTLAADAKRAFGAALFYLIVIDLLLPFLAQVAGLNALRYVLLPVDLVNPLHGVVVMAAHAGVAFGLLRWRLHRAMAALWIKTHPKGHSLG